MMAMKYSKYKRSMKGMDTLKLNEECLKRKVNGERGKDREENLPGRVVDIVVVKR